MRRAVIRISSVLTLAAACVLSAQTPPATARVLVMPFAVQATAATPAPWAGEAAAVLVADALEARGITTVTRDVRVAAFDRLELPMMVPLTRATVVRVGELVGASEIVFGEIEASTTFTVRARVVRIGAASETIVDPDSAAATDFMTLFDRVGGRVAKTIGRGTAAPTDRGVKVPADAFENYAKALVAATPALQQRLLETALKQAPRDGRILTALASLYAGQGQSEKALAAAAAVPADSSQYRKARLLAATSLIDLNRLDGAFRELTALATDRPAPVVQNALGVVQLRRGTTADGSATPATYFKRAVDLDPENTDYLFNLGYAFALAHDSAAALSWLRETVRRDAAVGDAHLVMSAVLASTGRTAEASRELDLAKMLSSRPDLASQTVSDRIPAKLERLPTTLDVAPLTRLQAAMGAPDQRGHEESAAYYLDRGRALITEQRDREAVAALQRAVYLSPYDDEPHVLLGRLYARGGRGTDAIDEFKVAIWCKDSAAARVGLSSAYLDGGDPAGAKREAERALALDPNSADARAILKKIGGDGVLTSRLPHG